PRRSRASAARLKMASATSISMSVKPSWRARLADNMDTSVAADVDRRRLVATAKRDPGRLCKAGGIEAQAGLAAAADVRDGALGPVIMSLGAPDTFLAPGDLIAAAADLHGDRPGFENGGVARIPRARGEAFGFAGK